MKIFSHLKKKARSRRYPADTISGAECADDLELLTNATAQVECLLHPELINLYVNLDKTEFMYFNQDLAISSLNGKLLKEVIIYEALCFYVAQGWINGAPNETWTQSRRFASIVCKLLHYHSF